jgi:hypothetical protein
MDDKPTQNRDSEIDPSLGKPSQESNSPKMFQDDNEISESLFENYQPRSASMIVAQQRELQESHAAEAAAIILEGVEPPEFEFPVESAVLDDNPSLQLHHIRVQRTSPLGYLYSPGAQFIYALLIITLLSGLIGLAATIESPVLILSVGIASPILLPICIWKWIRWLDSSPYYYRLLTSLGEDARNLINHRLFWKRSRSNS